jgi:hypothetical protein
VGEQFRPKAVTAASQGAAIALTLPTFYFWLFLCCPQWLHYQQMVSRVFFAELLCVSAFVLAFMCHLLAHHLCLWLHLSFELTDEDKLLATEHSYTLGCSTHGNKSARKIFVMMMKSL